MSVTLFLVQLMQNILLYAFTSASSILGQFVIVI